MNIKLHTPKSLKKGSGISSLKQFLLSLVATTISIALTFGTAAIIDNHKKKAAKREIVMMVMYDMYNSLQLVANADSMIHESMDLQLKFAKDPSLFKENPFAMIHLLPRVDYTETVEKIFSSSIESINTVGNVLFAENVANFYSYRKSYKEKICDSMLADLEKEHSFSTLKGTLDYWFGGFSVMSGEILYDMQQLFAQCQKMMDITDEQLQVYCKKREELNDYLKEKEVIDSLFQSEKEKAQEINEAKKNLRLN